MDFSKLRTAVVDLWRFTSPALVTTGILCLIAVWIAPNASMRTLDAMKPWFHLPSKETRETLAYFGVDKLIPVIVAFLFLLVIYLISRMAEVIGEVLPPHIAYAPANIATRVIGNVSAGRLKVHLRCTSDQDVWDRSEEYVSTLDTGRSKAAMGISEQKKLEWAACDAWYQTKFIVLWVLLTFTLELRFSGFRHAHWGRLFLAAAVSSVFSVVYFLKTLSVWKNYVGSVMRLACLGMTEDVADLDKKAETLPRPDVQRNYPAFFLLWRPAFISSMEPDLLFDLTRFPFLLRLLTGRNQSGNRQMGRKR